MSLSEGVKNWFGNVGSNPADDAVALGIFSFLEGTALWIVIPIILFILGFGFWFAWKFLPWIIGGAVFLTFYFIFKYAKVPNPWNYIGPAILSAVGVSSILIPRLRDFSLSVSSSSAEALGIFDGTAEVLPNFKLILVILTVLVLLAVVSQVINSFSNFGDFGSLVGGFVGIISIFLVAFIFLGGLGTANAYLVKTEQNTLNVTVTGVSGTNADRYMVYNDGWSLDDGHRINLTKTRASFDISNPVYTSYSDEDIGDGQVRVTRKYEGKADFNISIMMRSSMDVNISTTLDVSTGVNESVKSMKIVAEEEGPVNVSEGLSSPPLSIGLFGDDEGSANIKYTIETTEIKDKDDWKNDEPKENPVKTGKTLLGLPYIVWISLGMTGMMGAVLVSTKKGV